MPTKNYVPKSGAKRGISYIQANGKPRYEPALTGPCDCGRPGKRLTSVSNCVYECDRCKELRKANGRHHAVSDNTRTRATDPWLENEHHSALKPFKNDPINWSCHR